MRAVVPLAAVACLTFLTLGKVARAQDPNYQAFFVTVCTGAPAGGLATRCAETPGAGGDLSDDSENSLNPSQALTANAAALARTRALADDLERHLEEKREAGVREGESRMGFFANGRYGFFDRDESSRERGLDGQTYGPQMGVDYWVTNNALLGLLVGYEQTNSEFDSDAPGVAFTPFSGEGQSDTQNYSLTIFGSSQLNENVWIDGMLGYGYTRYDLKRRVVFQETNRVVPQTSVLANADPSGGEAYGAVGAGYLKPVGGLNLGIYGRANYTRSWLESYSESDQNGSGLAMNVRRQTQDSLQGTIGLEVDTPVNTSWAVLVPYANAEYIHEFDHDGARGRSSFIQDTGNTPLSLEGNDGDSDYGIVGAGVSIVRPNGWMAFLDAEARVGDSDFERYILTLGFRKEL